MEAVLLDLSLKMGVAFGKEFDASRLRDDVAVALQDLALPASARVETRISDDLRPDDFQVFFDGLPCPHRRERRRDEPLDMSLRRVMREVDANLDCLITRSVADALWRAWRGARENTPEEFTRLLRRLARSRLRVDRISAGVARWAETDPDTLFEEALSAASRSIAIELHPDVYAEMAPHLAETGAMIDMMIDGIFYELGVHTGTCLLKEDPLLGRGDVRIRVNDVRTPPQSLIESDRLLVNDTVERLRLIGVEGRVAFNPANDNECATVTTDAKEVCERAGLTTWTPAGYLALIISSAIRRTAPSMISREVAQLYLDRLEPAFPTLINLASDAIGVKRLARVLRLLLEEEISIRDLPTILDRMLTLPPATDVDLSEFIVFTNVYDCMWPLVPWAFTEEEQAAIAMSECVRMVLKRYISHKYTRGQNTLIVYLVDPALEKRLADARPLSPAEARSLLDAFDNEVGSLPPTAQTPVALTTASIRYRLRQELRGAFPGLAVLSYQELSPDMNIQPIARVSDDNFGALGEDPYDIIDRALRERRYAHAEQELMAIAAGEWPLHGVRGRLAKLLAAWTESGQIDEIVRRADRWIAAGLIPHESADGFRAAVTEGSQAAMRQWLSAAAIRPRLMDVSLR